MREDDSKAVSASRETLQQCLLSLSTQCESLCVENEALKCAKTSLEERLSIFTLKASYPLHAGLDNAADPPNASLMNPSSTSPLALPNAVFEYEATVSTTPKIPVLVQMENHCHDSKVSDSPVKTCSNRKDCTDLHPSASDGSGICLASSKLGMLGGMDTTGAGDAEPTCTQADLCTIVDVFQQDGPVGARKVSSHLIDNFVYSMAFKVIQTLAIVGNTLYMGLSADHLVKQTWCRLQGQPSLGDWVIPDIMFSCWFAIELMLRVAADRKDFFIGHEYRWNLFDAFLVASSVCELLIPGLHNMSFLRIFRVFKVVRVVRVVRTVQCLQSLRTMIFALLNSFVCLMWAFVMIGIIVFIFSIIFGGAVSVYFDKVDATSEAEMQTARNVAASFGTLYDIMVTLFSAVTGGNDWMGYGELLREIGRDNGGETYFLIFLFYIGFCLVGMLNVVTGIFVDSAVCTRTDDEVVQSWKDDLQRTSEEVRNIFQSADKDCSGTMTYDELAEQLQNPRVRAYFSGLEIDPSESGIIFTLLDTDGDGHVSVEEFICGTMRLKGHAKSVDIMAMMFDQAKFHMKFNKLCSYLEDQMRELKDAVVPERDPGAAPTPRMFVPLRDSLTTHHKLSRCPSLFGNVSSLAASHGVAGCAPNIRSSGAFSQGKSTAVDGAA